MNTDFFLLFLYADETYSVRLRRFFDSPVPPLAKRIVLKSSRPSLPLKKAPPLISVFFNGLYTPFGSPVCGGQKPQGRRGKPPYSVLEPLRFIVGGESKPCAMLCGMGPPGVEWRVANIQTSSSGLKCSKKLVLRSCNVLVS